MNVIRRGIALVRRFKRMNWALADQAVISLANFVTVYLLALSMPVEDFGIFSLLFTALMVAVALQNALISQPHNVLGAKLGREEYIGFTSALALFQVVLAVAVCLTAAIVGVSISIVANQPIGGTIALLGMVSAPWMLQEFVRRTFYTRSDSRAAFVNDVLCYGLQVVGIALLTLGEASTTESALLVMGGSSLVASGLGAWQLRGVITVARSAYRADLLVDVWRRNWGFGRWLTARAAVEWFRAHGHTWLLAAMLGPAAVGAYRAAYNLANVLNPFALAVQAYVPSRAGAVFASGGVPALRHWMSRNFIIAGSLYTLVVLAVIVAAGPLLELFYGGRFADVTPYLKWVLIISAVEKLLRKVRYFPGSVLLVMERTRELFLFDLVSIAILLGAGVALIGAFGILGAPLAKLVAAATVLCAVAWHARGLLSTHQPTEGPLIEVAGR